jgi:hypothetical protein
LIIQVLGQTPRIRWKGVGFLDGDDVRLYPAYFLDQKLVAFLWIVRVESHLEDPCISQTGPDVDGENADLVESARDRLPGGLNIGMVRELRCAS